MNRRLPAIPDQLQLPDDSASGTVLNIDPVREIRRDREQTIADHFWTVVDGWWIVAGVTGLALLIAGAYLFVATPIYEANALIQVDDRSKTVATVTDLNAMFDDRTPAEAEIEMIHSRTIIGAVVEELDLDIEARPHRLPLLGDALARRYHGRGPAGAVLELSRFAWGGERIQVQRLEVSDDLVDVPMSLVALEGGAYRLTVNGGVQLEGTVGTAASAADGERRVELLVSDLAARPGTQFHLKKRRRADVVDELQKQLMVTEKGKKAGVLLIELEGRDPQLIAAIVSELSATYLRQNVERRSAEAAKTLEFVESQLPVLKSTLASAEAALNSFKRGTHTVDLSREAQSMLDRSADLDKQLSELELQRSELRQRFTDNHPQLITFARKAESLRAERAAINARMRGLPETEADSARLVRDVKVATETYLVLLNKAQELRVAKSGTIGNVRVLDQARVPHDPVRPRTLAVLVVSLLLGLGGGVAAAIGRRGLDRSVHDVEEIEAGTGLPVYVTIPHSEKQAAIARVALRGGQAPMPVLSAVNPGDVAIESLRSLRTSLQVTLGESQNNIVTVVSPTPGVGKSFVGLNLADVFAALGKKVLLVDADLRRGHLHRHFGMSRQPGLSDVVNGAVALDAAISNPREGQLYFLPTGTIPPNPAEILSSQGFEWLLREASKRFDIVIVDTPPLLAVTDSVLVARFAGVNLLVLRAGHHQIREIAMAVRRLEQSRIKVQGAVLNDLSGSGGRYRRYDYAYEYSTVSD
jgi:tyrosine-protein kinase Etk/Wzc